MLRIHRAERSDRLLDVLASIVAVPFEDPFTAEVVAVPTRGVERWLTQGLSGRLGTSPATSPATSLGTPRDRADGVCANIEFPFPATLVGRSIAAASGVDRDADPWLPERSVWPLLDVVQDSPAEEWLAPLAAYLRTGADTTGEASSWSRRLSTVRSVADLFDRYSVHRPTMLTAWANDEDRYDDGRLLPADARWQPRLWRRLRDLIGTPSPAERLKEACTRLAGDPGLLDLPERVSVFGLTRLPAAHLDVLRAIAGGRDVHLFLLHPSPVLWERVARMDEFDRPRAPRRKDTVPIPPSHPLLATWGRDSREMQMVLGTGAGPTETIHHALDANPDSALRRLQADIRADRSPPGLAADRDHDERHLLHAGDRSIQVHACHGRARQVEVLRDAILHILADDSTIEPRDVIVMCPDIEEFAPLIQATFGITGPDDFEEEEEDVPAVDRLPDLRARLADRSIRQTNAVLAVVSELLTLAAGRLTASEVVDFAGREPVRRRFGFDDDDLERIEGWVAAAGVRWGLDGAHRAPYKLEALEENTWRAGLDRILVGVTMSEDDLRLAGDVLPLDDVGSGDIDLAGRLAELLDRLGIAIDTLAGEKTIDDWAGALAGTVDSLTATAESDAWQRMQLQRILHDVVAHATTDEMTSTIALDLAEVQSLLSDRLRGRPTWANFRTGHLTVCTLVPMRSVPHRVVCLLGLDDGTFPRRTAPDGDDLVQREPRIGDSDPRSEDRQLLLDALLAATDNLVVTYGGRDERTNAEKPPAVPVGEFLDVVDSTFRADPAEHAGTSPQARQQILVHHPLQPTDARNFRSGALVPARPWSFDPVALGGAHAAEGGRTRARPFLTEPLSAEPSDVVELDDLARFVQNPAKAFLRQRLGIATPGDEGEAADALPVALDPLEKWGVGQRILEARLAGRDVERCIAAEMARGTLPPGALGRRALADVLPIVEGILDMVADEVDMAADRESVQVDVDLGGGRTLVGGVTGVVGDVVLAASYSKLAPKHRVAAWVRLLALTAARPDVLWRGCTIGRGEGHRTAIASIGALADDSADRRQTALRHLGTIVDLRDRGLCEPLPLYCQTSAEFAIAVDRDDDDPEGAARKKWQTARFDMEDRDLEHQRVLGGVVEFEELLTDPPRTDEQGKGWPDEPTRFGCYARRLWDDILAREEVRVH